MILIKFKNLDEKKFINELNNIKFNKKSQDIIKIEINNAVCKNIKILIDYLIRNKVEEVILFKKNNNKESSFNTDINLDTNIDLLLIRIFSKFLNLYYIILIEKINIIFENLSQSEITNYIEYPLYVVYCRKNNLKLIHDKKLLKLEKKKFIENKQKFLKYNEINIFKEYLEKYPFSKFYFLGENDYDNNLIKNLKVILYLYVYNTETKFAFLNLLKQIKFKEKSILELIKNNNYDIINGYAIEINYHNYQIIKYNLYPNFLNPFNLDQNLNFIKEIHNINFKFTFKNVNGRSPLNYYKISIDNNFEKANKIIFLKKNNIFKEKIEKKNLKKIFINKNSNKSLIFIKSNLYEEKFEFNLKQFTKNELEILKNEKLYLDNYNKLTIYIKNNKIIRRVLFK